MTSNLQVEDRVSLTIAKWIMAKNNLPSILVGRVKRTTDLAVMIECEYGDVWLPRSSIIHIGDNVAEQVENNKPWVVEEHEGYTNRLVRKYYFETEEEAKEKWKDYKNANKYAGVGGKWTHYYTYPKKTKE